MHAPKRLPLRILTIKEDHMFMLFVMLFVPLKNTK